MRPLYLRVLIVAQKPIKRTAAAKARATGTATAAPTATGTDPTLTNSTTITICYFAKPKIFVMGN